MDYGEEDSDYSDMDYDRTKHRKRKPGKKDKDDRDTEESTQSSSSHSAASQATKHPIILAKPSSEWPAPPRTPDVSAASPSRLAASPMMSSPAAESKPIVMLRQREEGRVSNPAQAIPSMLAGEGQLPQAPPHYLIQRNPAASSGSTISDVGGQGKLSCPHEMTQAIKLVDESLSWCDSGMEVVLDQTDFLTVGVLGAQGSGKSTIMSMLAGNKPLQNHKSYMFRPQCKEVREVGGHQTNGLDMYVTSERIILLDAQPMLSSSLVDQMVHNDKKYPPEYNSVENFVEMQSLQIASFMMTVCNVVVIVLDWFIDLTFLRFIQTAEMLKPGKPSGGHEGSVIDESQEYYPQIVFVLNKAGREDFSVESQRSMQNVLSQVLEQSKLKYTGDIGSIGTPSGVNNKCMHSDVNLFLLPSVSGHIRDNCLEILADFEGHPSYEKQIRSLRKEILSVARTPLTHASLSEKNWFHYAARTWEAVKKSQLLAEYNRLLS